MTPFLMFCGPQAGKAEEAVRWYAEVFPGAQLVSVDHWPEGGPEPAGSVLRAVIEIAGQSIVAMDSSGPHEFTFNPAVSFFVECSSTDEVDRLGSQLVEGGQYLMPPGDYGFSPRFAWVADRYGVSWQLIAS